MPSELVDELKLHKRDVIALLRLKGRKPKYPGSLQDGPSEKELAEIASTVENEGYVLLWSNVLCDLVAFYRDQEDKKLIPSVFVAYSKAELRELFGDKALSSDMMKLIHEAKKQGGKVVSSEPCRGRR